MYEYDAEGRQTGVLNSLNGLTGYVYDAEGERVMKGTIGTFNCNPASNGFSVTNLYTRGLNGEDQTESAASNGSYQWEHTNVFAGAELLATYNGTETYFALNDWLGTKRAEATPDGKSSTYSSLPWGNGLTASGTIPDATAQHFTGKERDTESGLDYFGARYYGSSMGRFMSPDWSATVEPVPYARLDDPQSLNLYSYVGNNPLSDVDSVGHCGENSGWLAGNGYAALALADSCDSGATQSQLTNGVNIGSGYQVAAQQQNTEIAQEDAPEPPDAVEERVLEAEREDALRPLEPGEKVGRAACPGCIFPGDKGRLSDKDAANFDFYMPDSLKEPLTVYRIYGGSAHLEGRDGTYYSVDPPEGSPEDIRQLYSILSEWGNDLSKTREVTIPAGTTIYIGPAAVKTSETGVVHSGGGLQVFVPK